MTTTAYKGYWIERDTFLDDSPTKRTVYYTIGDGEWRVSHGPLGDDFRSVAEAKVAINAFLARAAT